MSTLKRFWVRRFNEEMILRTLSQRHNVQTLNNFLGTIEFFFKLELLSLGTMQVW